MYGNGLTVLVSKRFEGPESPPVESERWWLEMARRKKQAATGPGRQVTAGRAAGSVGCSVHVPATDRMPGLRDGSLGSIPIQVSTSKEVHA